MNSTTGCNCKVDQKAEEYNLADLDENLYYRHQTDGASLRDLEEYVNKRILESTLEDVDIVLLDGVDSVYQVLKNDEISEGKRVEISSRLAHVGVDIEKLERDFVTYQTIRKHLREGLDIDTGKSKKLDTAAADTRIQRLQSRSEAVIMETLQQLRRTEKLETGTLDLIMSAYVTCEDCSNSYQLRELLENGKCQCRGNFRD